MEKYIQKAAVLIEALPYLQHFKGSVFVLKVGGSIMEEENLTKNALKDIIFLKTVGIKPVIVHGGGKAITAKLKELDIPTKFICGQRYTCDETIKVVDDVLHNVINADLVKTINDFGCKGIALSGKEIFTASKAELAGPDGSKIDLGLVGDIYRIDTAKIEKILAEDYIPVITPLALSEDKKTIFNVNADIAGAKVAQSLKSRKLVFVSDVPGLLQNPKDESTLISTVHMDEIGMYISNGVISGGMLPKINSAVEALEAGTNKVHLIDGRIRHSILLEIFTDTGIGTQIIKRDSSLNINPDAAR